MTAFFRTFLFSTLSAAIFVMPIIFSFGTNQIFEVNKFFVLSLCTGICAFIFGIWSFFRISLPFAITKKERRVFLLLGILILWMGISTFLAQSPGTAFFGDSERHQGIFFWTNLFLLFSTVFLLSPSEKEAKTFFLFPLLISGVLVSLFAISQSFGEFLFFSSLQVEDVLGRSFSTLGQPNFLAQFLLFSIFGVLAFFSCSLKQEQGFFQKIKTILFPKKEHSFQILLLSALLILFLWALWTTGSRAGIFGLLCGLGFFGVSSLPFIQNLSSQKKAWLLGGFFLSLILFWVLIMLNAEYISGERTRSLLVRSETALSAFPLFWLPALFFGIGLEHFGSAFMEYAPVSLLKLEGFLFVPDRIHSFPIDFSIAIGFGGFLLLLLFFGNVLLSAFENNALFQKILASGAIAGFCSWLFGFPVTTDAFLFFIFLGIVFGIAHPKSEEKTFFPQYFHPIMAIVFLVWGGMSIWVASTTLLSDRAFYRFYSSETVYETEAKEITNTLLKTPSLQKNILYSARKLLSSGYLKEAEELIAEAGSLGIQSADLSLAQAELFLVKGEREKSIQFLESAEQKSGNALTMLMTIVQYWRQIDETKREKALLEKILSETSPFWNDAVQQKESFPEEYRKFWKHFPHLAMMIDEMARISALEGDAKTSAQYCQSLQKTPFPKQVFCENL